MLDQLATRIARRYLRIADQLLPGRITGFYLTGSAALGTWRRGHSDLDFVAVLEGEAGERDLRRLRALHVAGNTTTLARAVITAKPNIPGTMNGVFVAEPDLTTPVTRIRPLAAHSGWTFTPGKGFDVNPVMWKLLAEHGLPLRGPAPAELGLDPEPGRLRAWTLEQLTGYWHRLAERLLGGHPPAKPLIPPPRLALMYTLGPPRLHHTVATGEVISKEAAAAYALDTFDPRWHPLIHTALARRTGTPAPSAPRPHLVPRLTGEFFLHVIDHARSLRPPSHDDSINI
ncbi:nucleotidyltransferase domain-containing protein [Thermopolyspora sp. NPDC052614]|uniref:nucleotidyltransferase domain-containing protein n=1 Tax=Thermopolyspora sp. NPDC052614 TaxID=3155682 RepID=UPI00341CCDAB